MAITFTATPDVDNARVVVTTQGGVTGDRFYMIRRDDNGSNLIRETSETGALWLPNPAGVRTNLSTNPSWRALLADVVVRQNLATNPSAASTTNWGSVSGTGGTAALTNEPLLGRIGAAANRVKWSAATTAVSGGIAYTQTGLAAATQYACSIWVRPSKDQTVILAATFQTSDAATVNTVSSTPVALLGGRWTQLFVSGTSGAAVDRVQMTVTATTGGTNWVANDYIDGDDVLIETGLTLGTNFDGASLAGGDFTYGWSGTANASISQQKAPGVAGLLSVAGQTAVHRTFDTPMTGMTAVARTRVLTTGNVGINVDDAVVADNVARTGSLWVRASAAVTVQPRWRTTGAATVNAGAAITLTAGVWTEIVRTGTPALDAANASLGLVTSTALPIGATIDVGRHHTELGNTIGAYFDGSMGGVNAWTGTANASTSTNNEASLPITLYDYEARQGMVTDYILTDENGVSAASTRLTIPAWGTWLKDPFRPFMNVKLLWNSDDQYTRRLPHVVLQARGAKYPVIHSDRRQAPTATVRVMTETRDQAKALIALLDRTSVVMIDVDYAFGVPVRYVSVGDITGMRAASEKDRNLTWDERYWDLPITEVAAPVGAPVAQSLTYDMIPASFGSYIAIPASVDSYNNLASGLWS